MQQTHSPASPTPNSHVNKPSWPPAPRGNRGGNIKAGPAGVSAYDHTHTHTHTSCMQAPGQQRTQMSGARAASRACLLQQHAAACPPSAQSMEMSVSLALRAKTHTQGGATSTHAHDTRSMYTHRRVRARRGRTHTLTSSGACHQHRPPPCCRSSCYAGWRRRSDARCVCMHDTATAPAGPRASVSNKNSAPSRQQKAATASQAQHAARACLVVTSVQTAHNSSQPRDANAGPRGGGKNVRTSRLIAARVAPSIHNSMPARQLT